MKLTDLDWEDVKCFRAAADNGTLRAAAMQLGVHHSTVSRRIENLEKQLRARLIERTPDGHVLTPAGEDILKAADAFAAELQDADRKIAGRDDVLEGVVRVTAANPIAIAALAPHLHRFADANPELHVHLLTSFDVLDLARREADVAIRMENNPAEDLVGKRLFPYFETVYASPDYLAAHNLETDPGSARWIGWRSSDTSGSVWVRDTAFPNVPVWGAMPDLAVQQMAARNGLGLAMLPCILGDRDPDLVRASKRPPTPARDIWILTHPDLRRVARIRAFMQFTEAILRSLEADFRGEHPHG